MCCLPSTNPRWFSSRHFERIYSSLVLFLILPLKRGIAKRSHFAKTSQCALGYLEPKPLLLWKHIPKWRSTKVDNKNARSNTSSNMDMLDYCKTYNMVKSSYANQESTEQTSQESTVPTTPQNKLENNGEIVVESVQSLSTKPGDLALYRSTSQLHKGVSDPTEKKLSPLKEVARNKGMISTLNTKTHQRVNFECELTFAPKLNALSIKLAKERGEKVRTGTDKRVASSTDEFTFKPKVSSNSVKIMQQLKTTFMDRQQMHVEKQKRYVSTYS